MHLFGLRVFEQQDVITRQVKRQTGNRLRAVAAAMLTLAAGVPAGIAQQATTTLEPNKDASTLPAAPTPETTEPLDLRQSTRNFSKPSGPLLGNPINMYRGTTIAKADFNNSVRLADLVKDGKIYLSLSDAIALALENNYDIAIDRYYLDIADTDILRTKAGAALRGVGATVLQNTLGGTSQTLSASGSPGSVGGATAGVGGLVTSVDTVGPVPENRDPQIGGAIQFDRQKCSRDERLFSPVRSQIPIRTTSPTIRALLPVHQWLFDGNSSRVTTN